MAEHSLSLGAAPAQYAPVTAIHRHDIRLEFIRELPAGAKVLDAGCGAFKTLLRLQAARPDLRFYGLDQLDVASQCPAGIEFARVNFETGAFPFTDAQFDAIFFCHVLEHLQERMTVLAEFARVLKPGGRIYIEGPSTRSLWLPSLPGLRSQDPANAIGDDLNFFDNFTHVRPLTRRGLQMFLQMAGCACPRSGFVRHPRKLLAAPGLLLGGLLLRRRRWVCLALWELFGWSVYAVGVKNATAGGLKC